VARTPKSSCLCGLSILILSISEIKTDLKKKVSAILRTREVYEDKVSSQCNLKGLMIKMQEVSLFRYISRAQAMNKDSTSKIYCQRSTYCIPEIASDGQIFHVKNPRKKVFLRSQFTVVNSSLILFQKY